MKKPLILIMLLGCALVYLHLLPFSDLPAFAEPAEAPAPQTVAPAVEPSQPAAVPVQPAVEQAPAPAAAVAPPDVPAKHAEQAPKAPAASSKQDHSGFATMAIKECNVCHKAEGIAQNHDVDFIVRGHRELAGMAGSNCSQCHQQNWCLDCHQGGGDGSDASKGMFGRDYKPKSHRTDYINIHPIKAHDNQQSCYRCHDTKYCNDCHSRFPKGALRIKSHMMLGTNGQQYTAVFGEHSAEARRNLQSC